MNVNIALSKLKLFKELDGNRMHILTFGIYKENMRMYVREADRNNMRDAKLVFNTAIMPMNARVLVEELLELHNQDDKYKFQLDMFGPKWVDNKRVDNEIEKMGSVGVVKTKNKDGDVINILYLESKVGTKFIFPLVPTPYVKMVRNSKELTDPSLTSSIWTKAYGKSLEALLNLVPESRVAQDTQTTYAKPNNAVSNIKPEDLDALM